MTVPRWVIVFVAAGVLLVIAGMAIFPTLFSSVSPVQTNVREALLPPSGEHWFGTDQSGRDVYSRVVHGAARSVGIGVVATALALVSGLLLGLLSGISPRAIDQITLRTVDILQAFPEFLLALLIVALWGPGPLKVAVAVTIAAIPIYLRLSRAHTLVLLKAEHVEAARILGISPLRVLARHVVPAVFGSLSVLATIGVGSAILAAAGLSFLGLGPSEPQPEWGLMLASGRNLLGEAWWVAFFPGLAITLTVVSVTVIGRTLRARSDGRGI